MLWFGSFECRKGRPYAFIPYTTYMVRVLFPSRKTGVNAAGRGGPIAARTHTHTQT